MNTTLKTQPATFEDIDPATGEVIATVEITSAAEIEATVARAQAAWSGWAATPLEQRLEMLRKGCAAMYAMRDEMAQMIVREMGKVLPDAEGEIEGWWGSLDGTFAEYSEAFAPEVTAFKRHRTTRYRDAHGVVAAVAPWNFPMRMPIGIVMPALAAGNAVVLKPTEHAPMVGAMIVEAFAPHLPKDVIQLVQGEGATGAALVASDVDMVGFVGSRATGSAIM
ncbi:MAG: acyl-CoA reductase-like NAD-dependent aldehyde dehydrogenase, partial [Planctomycetota bacterium]